MSDRSLWIHKYNSKTLQWSKEPISKEERVELIDNTLNLPGDYDLDHRMSVATKEADNFLSVANGVMANGYYTALISNTRDWRSYWEHQKDLCYTGILIDDEFYIPGDLYWYLNFIIIPDKVKRKNTFPRLFDTDLWAFALIEKANLTNKFTVTVKKRQIGWSLKMLARLLKRFWFEEGFVGRIASWDEKYVKDDWSLLELFKDHLNDKTAWYRNLDPDKSLEWKQRVKMGDGTYKGLNSALQGVTFRTKPTKVVGGKVDEIFIEEAGIAPNLTDVVEFANAALKFGDIITGNLHIAGAVGDLKDCKPLKTYIYDPDTYNMLSLPNVWSDKPNTRVGIFVPEEYSYGSHIDQYGNSLVDKAKVAIEAEAEEQKKKSYRSFMIYKSQSPSTLEDAFANREENIYPTEIIQPHFDWLDQHYKPMVVELEEEQWGLVHKFGSKYPVVEDFPIKKDTIKQGAIVIEEAPVKNPPMGLYYAGVDTVAPIKTTSSVSLQCIYIYKAAHEIDGEYSQDKIVAWYTGRYTDDPYNTFRITKKLINYYNARACIENDHRSFIEWMIKEKQHKHLMRRSDLPLTKDMVVRSSVDNSEYGIKTGSAGPNGESTMKRFLISKTLEYVSEVIGTRFNDKTGESSDIYGVERIKDKMLLREMLDYSPGKNTDRIIAFGITLFCSQVNTYRGIKVSSSKTMKSNKNGVSYKKALSSSMFNRGTRRSVYNKRMRNNLR